MAKNLLYNPDGNDSLEYWDVTPGCWSVEDMPGPDNIPFINKSVTKYFAASSGHCLKTQVINLLESGFTTDHLDSQPPVTVEDWYRCSGNYSATYQITVSLLDGNRQVINKFQPGEVTLDPATDQSWIKAAYTFSKYGSGLRYISFQHGGKASNSQEEYQGIRVTESSVIVN